MLTPETAAKVAKEAGLSLADAAAIRALADDEEQARKIAAAFTASDKAGSDDSETFVSKLFSTWRPAAKTTLHLGGTDVAPDTPPAA